MTTFTAIAMAIAMAIATAITMTGPRARATTRGRSRRGTPHLPTPGKEQPRRARGQQDKAAPPDIVPYMQRRARTSGNIFFFRGWPLSKEVGQGELWRLKIPAELVVGCGASKFKISDDNHCTTTCVRQQEIKQSELRVSKFVQ